MPLTIILVKGHLNSSRFKAFCLWSRKYLSGLNVSFPYNGLSIGRLRELLYPKTETEFFLSKNSHARGSNTFPQVHATFFVNVFFGFSLFESKLEGVSKGDEPVKAEISEAPTALKQAFSQSRLPCVKPVSLEAKNSLYSIMMRAVSVELAIY